MAWLAVNKDGTEWIMPEKPVRGRCGHWEYLEEVYNVPIEIELPKGTVYKLLGKE
ncbi:fructan hydrolase exo-beta-D-fructosidase, partial [human gut metagenome]